MADVQVDKGLMSKRAVGKDGSYSAKAHRFAAPSMEIDPASLFLGFANEATEEYFLMQRSETCPPETLSDVGNIYLERDDQCMGGYGGIAQVTLSRERLSVRLNRRMAKRMACSEIIAEFSLTKRDFKRVKTQIRQIMAGHESITNVVE